MLIKTRLNKKSGELKLTTFQIIKIKPILLNA